MKRLFSMILVLCMLLASVAVAETWTCSQCGAQNEHNFCGDCGAKKSDEWTCSGCGKKNTTKFCPDCGMARDDNQPKVTATPKPTEIPKAEEAVMVKVRPRIEFQAGEGKCRVYLAYDNVVYAKDYHEDTNYYIGCLVENHGANEITVTPSAEINGETYSFNPRAIVAGDDHGFMVTSVKLEPGTYTVKWFMDGQLTNDYTVTVKDEYSATYEWVKSKIDVSLGLSIWDDAGERRVKDGISIGELSELADGQRYIPHMAVTNNDIKDTPPLFVAFYLDDDSWWWEEQVLSPGKKMNYVHTSYKHKEGASELIFYINGIRVDRTMFAILGD